MIDPIDTEEFKAAEFTLNQLCEDEFGYDPQTSYPAVSRSFARKRTHALRSVGLSPDQIREELAEFCNDRMAMAGSYPVHYENVRQAAAEAVQVGITEALAEPPRRPLTELCRRRSSLVGGIPLLLANGECWSFPALPLERSAWVTPEGRETLGFSWRKAEWGPKVWRAMMRFLAVQKAFIEGSASVADFNPHFLRLGSMLLRSQYKLSTEECAWLIPVDGANPACMAEIGLCLSDEQPRSGLGSRLWIGSTLSGQASTIKLALIEYLKPTFAAISPDDINDFSQTD